MHAAEQVGGKMLGRRDFLAAATSLLIPILFTLGAVAGEAKCEAPRIFPFAMEGENLPDLWTLTRMREGRNLLRPHGEREPAGSGGFLTAKGADFVDESGRVRRFFGVNLYGPATLPEKADAPAMAERLARWGINAVRIFPQYTWQRRADQDFSKGIDPDLLDRFDWLFFQLKQRGISADMNLHSARTAGYRFKDFKQTMKENKGLDNFDPTFILHQKEFIRTVFNHVNPYTGLAYRDDPAVMTWEVNNECSLAIAWFQWNMEDKLTPYFKRELERQFRDWLRAKYGTTERLRAAWVVSAPLEPDVLPPETWKDAAAFARARWYTEGYGKGNAPKDYTFDPSKGLVRIDATQVRKFALVGVSLKERQPYTVSFRIRSAEPGLVVFKVGQHGRPYGGQGCTRTFQTGAEWKEVKMRAAALISETDNRVQVQFNKMCTYELADLSFVRGGELGLEPGESLEADTVGLGTYRSAARTRDISEFILDVENRYWKEMYAFVKHEMGARAPVNCGTADYGAHYPQAYGDFIDDHFYYGGLVYFPKKSWDMSNWSCKNVSIVRALDGGRHDMQRTFENRVLGKPFTISEANMMSQMATAAEFFPIALSVAAFQNTAAFHAYTWSHNSEHTYGARRFLDMRSNAKYLAHLPASVNMFVRGDVKRGDAASAQIVYDLGRQEERDAIIRTGFAQATHIHASDPLACLKALTGRRLLDLENGRARPLDAPYGRVAVYCDRDGRNELRPSHGDRPPRTAVSATGEIRWDATQSGKEWYAVDTPRTKFLSAFGPAGTSHMFTDGFHVTLGDTLMGWAAISFTELSPGKSLLAATGYQQASGAKLTRFGSDEALHPADGTRTLDERITTMTAMGNAPYACEGVRATIRIPAAGAVRVTPLDGNARPLAAAFTVQAEEGFATFDISEKYQTVWYLVEPCGYGAQGAFSKMRM